MKVVVTGGSGQLGTLVLMRLLRDRRIKQVVSIDLKPPRLPLGKLQAVQADVRDPGLAEHFAGADALIHLAFVVTELRPRAEVDEINVEGSKRVIGAAVAAGVKQVLYSSSVAAYGVAPGHPMPITEDAPRRFVSDFAYSATKYQVEAWLDELEAAHPEVAIVRMRPTILVGARMEHPMGDGLRRRMLVSLNDAPLPIVWDEDVADAFMLALKNKARGAFNLSADELLPSVELGRRTGLRVLRVSVATARRLMRLSAVLARRRGGAVSDPAWIERSGEGVVLVPTCERARRELGWQPRCATAVSVIRHYLETVPHRLDPRLQLFLRLAAAAAARQPPRLELSGYRSRVHVCLTGPRGGDFGLIVEDSRLRIVPHVPPRPPTAVVTMSAELMLDLSSGRESFGNAQLTGKLRLDGEGHAVFLVTGLLSGFRVAAESKGAVGVVGRGLRRLMQLGRPAAPPATDEGAPR